MEHEEALIRARLAMKPLVLSPAQQAEGIADLVAVRDLGLGMLTVFSRATGKNAEEALQGAERMVEAINRLLKLLDAPPELRNVQQQ
jgi:hypothetical protein